MQMDQDLLKKETKKDCNKKDSNINNDNVTETLSNHSDNSVCSLVQIEIFYIMFESI